MNKKEFSKLMMYADYVIEIALIIISLFNSEIVNLAIAWTAQVAVSTGFYYWKAKNENRIKIPMQILQSLNDDEENKLDLTQIITTLIDKD